MAIPKLPQKSITYLLVCGGFIIAYFFLAIYPSQMTLGEMDTEIGKINTQIAEQKIFFPVTEFIRHYRCMPVIRLNIWILIRMAQC